ncbi:VCBS repeat-containing protein [Lacinutrix sp. Hel_I_90]|uniref:FG-GAP repeat domain-containing protein n=1 Tax=Lacinutrix sp. Hel_I_90 TaxID=1249999 RepID=UPI0005C9193A|nr:VCBS repeat-containing protein [Lacinutrix sp. Hel_I_90]
MKYFLTLFLLTTNLYAQDVFLETQIPTPNNSIGNYEQVLNSYLNAGNNKLYYENVASSVSNFLNGTNNNATGTVPECEEKDTTEEKIRCYEQLANNKLYDLQILLKEVLDASDIVGVDNDYISRVIDAVFANVVDIKGTFTPEIINDVDTNKKSFFVEGEQISNQISYADINGDGYDDFVTRYIENGLAKIVSRISYGDGSFGDRIPTITSNDSSKTFYQTLGSVTRQNPFYLHDVNGDDNNDIIFVYHDNGLKVRVRLSDGRGKFSELPIDTQFTDGFGVLAQSINGLNVEHDIRFIDMNNDDILDMVYVNYSGGLRIRVRHGLFDGNGNGNGKFSNTLDVNESFTDGNGVMVQNIGGQKINHKMNILDINNDSYPDLAYVNSDNGNLRVRVRLSNGSGGFHDLEEDTFNDGTIVFGQTLDSQFIPHDFYFSDVNNDQFPDLVYMHHDNGLKVRVKLSNGDGTFNDTSQQNFPDGNAAFIQNIDGVHIKNKIQIIDINNDGNGDLVYRIKSPMGTEVRIRLSNLDGTFPETFIRNIIDFSNVGNIDNITDYSLPIVLADLNDNNKLDLINLTPNRIITNLNRVGKMPYMPYKKITTLPQFSDDKRENEGVLSLSQFMFLVSRYLNITNETGNKAKVLERYLNKWILEFPQSSLDQWNDRGTYYTHKTLVKYQQLQEDDADYNPDPIYAPLTQSSGEPFKAHTSAIKDRDLWIMASLVEYLSYNEGLGVNDDNKLDVEKLESYKNYLNQALALVKSRIDEYTIDNTGGKVGIKFDIGKWKDHPDSKYGDYDGILELDDNDEFYVTQGVDIGDNSNISYDFAHAYRFVDVFESFKRNNTLSNITELDYFNVDFMKKLANQVVYSLYDPQITSEGTVPRFKNYFNSDYNGWYRVNYDDSERYGFSPYQKSGAFIAGGFARLGIYNSDLAKLSVDIWNYRQSSIGKPNDNPDLNDPGFIDENYEKYFVPDTRDLKLKNINSGSDNEFAVQERRNITNDISFFSSLASYGTNYLYVKYNINDMPYKIYIDELNNQNRNINILDEIYTSSVYKEIKVYNMFGGLVKVYYDKKIIDLKYEFSGLYIIKTISKEDTKTGKFMF